MRDWQANIYDEHEAIEEDLRIKFQDPGGSSALRSASKNNPRIYQCPTCGKENMLTSRDVELGYQCDECASGCSYEDACCGNY